VLPAPDGSCPDEDSLPTAEDVQTLRLTIVCMINRERMAAREAPLHLNERIATAAQAHTESMAADGYFGHTGPAGDTPVDRLQQVGYLYSDQIGYVVGENIGWGTLTLSTPVAMVTAWMASPEHRANILEAAYRDTGVGVSAEVPEVLSEGESGGLYTQDFAVIVR
jgi:uncharacterized protein YkwD